MPWNRLFFFLETSPRRAAGAASRVGPCAGLVVLGLCGCAGPGPTPPVPAAAAAAPPAYASPQKVDDVSAALNQRLDHMLAAPATRAGQ